MQRIICNTVHCKLGKIITYLGERNVENWNLMSFNIFEYYHSLNITLKNNSTVYFYTK